MEVGDFNVKQVLLTTKSHTTDGLSIYLMDYL